MKAEILAQHRGSISTLALVTFVVATAALSGCSEKREEKAPMRNLPEAHGPMRFEQARPEADTNGAPSAVTGDAGSISGDSACATGQCATSVGEDQAASNEGTIEQVIRPSTSRERGVLCLDAHDPQAVQTPGVDCPTCKKGEFTQPSVRVNKLDILFVVDTSPSLATERAAIASGVRQFIEQLPRDTDYQIAAIAAHSDQIRAPVTKRSSRLAGKIMAAAGEPVILRKGTYGGNWQRLAQDLTRKLNGFPMDPATDGGEAGLFSLDRAISEPELSRNRRLGFFRPDAALAIVFISDENDLCSFGVNYPEGVEPKPNNVNITPAPRTEELANEAYCKNFSGGPITSRSVFEKLRSFKQSTTRGVAPGSAAATTPLLVSGILYTRPESVPTEPAANEQFREYFVENEVGYGYLDIIKDNQGVAVDISDEDFSQGLRQIGTAAALKMEVKSEYQLRDGSSIDPQSVCVLVNGREVPEVDDFSVRVDGLSYRFREDLREVHLRGVGASAAQGPGAAAKVEVFYCEKFKIDVPPEMPLSGRLPTRAEHYRNLPVPAACRTLKARIASGQLDGI